MSVRSRPPIAGVVCGRKICTSKFHRGPRWVLAVNFIPRTRWPEDYVGEVYPRSLQSYCLACHRLEEREKHGWRSVEERKKKVETVAQMLERKRLNNKRWYANLSPYDKRERSRLRRQKERAKQILKEIRERETRIRKELEVEEAAERWRA